MRFLFINTHTYTCLWLEPISVCGLCVCVWILIWRESEVQDMINFLGISESLPPTHTPCALYEAAKGRTNPLSILVDCLVGLRLRGPRLRAVLRPQRAGVMAHTVESRETHLGIYYLLFLHICGGSLMTRAMCWSHLMTEEQTAQQNYRSTNGRGIKEDLPSAVTVSPECNGAIYVPPTEIFCPTCFQWLLSSL